MTNGKLVTKDQTSDQWPNNFRVPSQVSHDLRSKRGVNATKKNNQANFHMIEPPRARNNSSEERSVTNFRMKY